MVRNKFQLRTPWRYKRPLLAFLCIVAIAVISLVKGIAQSQNPENLEEVIWVGHVRFDYEKTERYNGQSSVRRQNVKASNKWNEAFNAHLTIKACGKAGNLHILGISGNLNLNYDHQYRWKRDHQSCLDERARVERIVRPGDREYENEQRVGSISGQPSGMIDLNLLPGSNTYYLSAVGEINYRLSTSGESGIIWACSGRDQRSPIPQTPFEVSLPFALITSGGAGKEISGRKDLSPSAEEKKRRNDSLQGGLGEDIDEGTGHYDETITAEWHFAAKDPCQDVIQQVQTDLAFAEAYADKKIQDFASTLDEYEKLVGDKAYTITHGKPPSRGQGDFEEGGGPYVDPETCEIVGLEEYRQKLAEKCRPDIIIESIQAHEETHQRQCVKFNEEMNSGDPHIKGMMEATAYKTGIRVLLDWLETYCPNYDTSRDSTQLDKIRN
ncbi:MAG: hypothetical protein KAV87_68680 [Desulfobacteraceae bacterium]|nr:hypothetical protein [Desulfobacteraceae bacterium]